MHTMIYVPQSGDDIQAQASLLLVYLCTRPPYKHLTKMVFKLNITSHFLPASSNVINQLQYQRTTSESMGTRWLSWLRALRYKSEGRGFDSRWYHCNFSLT